MVAQSPAANPTSYAYYPANVPAGGDIWFGTAYNYSQAKLGNYYFATALHELGHALGLKHSQETGGVANVAVPAAHDNSEFTIMSYRSYVGAPLTGYTAESYGYPQTYMANDILALQTLYGANYSTHSENTVYSWSPTTGQQYINGVAQLAPGNGAGGSANRVFETVWDGNGIDTYDLSNYATGRDDQSQSRRVLDHLGDADRLSRKRALRAGQYLQRLFVQQRCAVLYRQRHRRRRQRYPHRQCDRKQPEGRRRQRHVHRRRRQRYADRRGGY